MVEEVVIPETATAHKMPHGLSAQSQPRRLVEIGNDVDERLPVAIDEFSRVLGGGVVPGSVVLIGGDPGIGKSTLLLQVALDLAQSIPVLYVSGEEAETQIKMMPLPLERGSAPQ